MNTENTEQIETQDNEAVLNPEDVKLAYVQEMAESDDSIIYEKKESEVVEQTDEIKSGEEESNLSDSEEVNKPEDKPEDSEKNNEENKSLDADHAEDEESIREEVESLSIDDLKKQARKYEKDQRRLNRNRREHEDRKKAERAEFEARKAQFKQQQEQFYRDVQAQQAVTRQAQEQGGLNDPLTWRAEAKRLEDEGNLSDAKRYEQRAIELEQNPQLQNAQLTQNQIQAKAVEYQRAQGFQKSLAELTEQEKDLADPNSRLTILTSNMVKAIPLQARSGEMLERMVAIAKNEIKAEKIPSYLDEIQNLKRQVAKLKKSTNISPSPIATGANHSIPNTDPNEVRKNYIESIRSNGMID